MLLVVLTWKGAMVRSGLATCDVCIYNLAKGVNVWETFFAENQQTMENTACKNRKIWNPEVSLYNVGTKVRFPDTP